VETDGDVTIRTATVGLIWETRSYTNQLNGVMKTEMDLEIIPKDMRVTHAHQRGANPFSTDWDVEIQMVMDGQIHLKIG
tara:strand:+ start:281 stop:517 length:237 start_codon:yes stop_codon:yes gene_type:complete